MGLTHVQWVMRKIPLDKESRPSMEVIPAPAAPGGGGGGGQWVTKVIRQLILAPASIGANDIKAAPR